MQERKPHSLREAYPDPLPPARETLDGHLSATGEENLSYRDRRLAVFKRRLAIGVVAAIWAISVVAVRVEYLTDRPPDDEIGDATLLQGIAWLVGLAFLLTVSCVASVQAWRHSGPRSWIAHSQDRDRRIDRPAFRNRVWIGRINGVMIVAMCFGGLAAGIFGPIFPGGFEVLAVALAVPPAAVGLFLCLVLLLWGWRTPL